MTDLEAIARDAAERVHKNGGCVPQLSFAPILFALQDALSTTPARAEAQDEGAAGEREAMESVMASVDPATWPGLSATHRAALGRFAKPQPHPSPTPAADEDRVRIAVEALERIKGRKQTCASDEVEAWELQDIASEALATLKSEAK